MDELIKINELVETVDGSMHPKASCRKMAGEYFLKGNTKKENSGQCYYINKKYYKYNTGYIVFDHSIKEYVIKNNTTLTSGVISINGDELQMGHYSDKSNEVKVLELGGSTFNCINASIFKGTNYIYDNQINKFVHRKIINVFNFYTPRPVPNHVKNSLPYDSRGLMNNLINHYNKQIIPISENVEKYHKILKDVTFGVEFETTEGQVNPSKCDDLGLMALRDGSIKGLEYVTIPLQGKKGLQSLVDTITELNKVTTFDRNCSVHFHIGNLPRTEEFMVALFKTLCAIQDGMYALFPLYKRYNFGVKRKHYTQAFPLPETIFQMDKIIDNSNIKQNFDVLYRYLSMGQSFSSVGSDIKNVEGHPSDPRGTSKWNIRTRYHWVNLIPLLFGNKETVEFRLHTPTYDHEKLVNYLVVCASIINFVKDNTSLILTKPEILHNLTLADIVYKVSAQLGVSACDKMADYIYNYLASRKDFIYHESRQGNIVGNEEKFIPRSFIKWGNNSSSKTIIFGTVKTGKTLRYRGGLSRNALEHVVFNIPYGEEMQRIDD